METNVPSEVDAVEDTKLGRVIHACECGVVVFDEETNEVFSMVTMVPRMWRAYHP